MAAPVAETVEDLKKLVKQEVLESMKDELRDGRALLKDLKQGIKEARTLLDSMVKEEIEPRLRKAATEEIERMKEDVQKTMFLASDKVNAEFDRLSKLLLGLDAKNRKKGYPSMEELIRNAVNLALEHEVLERAAEDPKFRARMERELGKAFKERYVNP